MFLDLMTTLLTTCWLIFVKTNQIFILYLNHLFGVFVNKQLNNNVSLYEILNHIQIDIKSNLKLKLYKK